MEGNCQILEKAGEDMSKINKQFGSADKLSVGITYIMYSDLKASQVIGKETMVTKKWGDNLYQKYEKVEIYQTNEFAVYIDHLDKTVTYLPAGYHKKKPFGPEAILEILKVCKTVVPVQEQKGLKGYDFNCSVEPYSSIKILFDKNFILQKLELVNEDAQKDDPALVAISFEYNKQYMNDLSFFDRKNFVIKGKDNKWMLSEKYKDYSLSAI